MRLTLNGEPCGGAAENAESTSQFLRDRLGLTGTKESCTTGACGACTVLVDGVAVLACLLPAVALDGREVRTVEGLGPTLHPVQRALVAHDGLQCGFCTPGFVMQGVAFYTSWRAARGTAAPDRAAVAAAFSGHLCRCGAYHGILDAMIAACRGDYDADRDPAGPRHDARVKVTGEARYTGDIRPEGLVFGAILRSPHAHARVKSVDVSRAIATPGVRAAVDILGVDRVVRYVGQEVAAVACDTSHAAHQALSLIAVDYEPLPAAIGMDAARLPGAPKVYAWDTPRVSESELPIPPEFWRGNVRGPFFAMSKRPFAAHHRLKAAEGGAPGQLVAERWRTQPQSHTPLEPHTALAHWTSPDALELYLSTQACADMADDVAARWHLSRARVTVIAHFVGGAFGGKAGVTGETIAAIELARAAGVPVCVSLQRSEELAVGGYRPGVEVDLRMAADAQGRITALSASAYSDGGVAIGSSVASLMRFTLPDAPKLLLDFDVASHGAPAKPFRGPGGPAACWALERSMELLAARTGMDSLALRRLQTGGVGRQQDLWKWIAALPAWADRHQLAGSGRMRRGRGLAIGAWGYFVQPQTDVRVFVDAGVLCVATACQDMGTGSRSVLADAVGQVFGVPPESVDVRVGDSRLARGPISSGSRTTASIRPAALAAARQLRAQLPGAVAAALGLTHVRETANGIQFDGGSMTWSECVARVPAMSALAGRPADRKPFILPFWLTPLFKNFQIGQGVPISAHIAEVEVDMWLGRVRVTHMWAAISVGDIALLPLATSQVRGGAIQGIGYALYEERVVDPSSGVPLTTSLDDYHMPGPADTPPIDVTFIDGGFDHVQGGGVGLGEISTIGVSAAIGNAVAHATGWQPTELPLRPSRVLAGLAGVAGGGR